MKHLVQQIAAGLAITLLLLVACGADKPASPAASRKPAAAAPDGYKVSLSDDWPWWRGPTRDGIAPAGSTVPVKFSSTENVVWKTPVPGRGHSSPIVVGDLIVLTTADDKNQVQGVVAFDRRSGKQLWIKEISRGGFPREIHNHNTHATPTVASDGELLFVTFNHHDTIQACALDFQGKLVWDHVVGQFAPRKYEWGYAPSPVMFHDFVIVSAEYEAGYLAALNRKTGKPEWQEPRDIITYSTPQIASVAGREQLFLSGGDRIASYDPASGKSLWSTPGVTSATCGTMVTSGDIMVASGGYPKSETLAVRGDGGEVVWRNKYKCYEQSLLAYDGYIYAHTDNGVAVCIRASDGKEMWKQRVPGKPSASAVLVGGHIYWANERGVYSVFKPNPERFELVAENTLGDEAFASPAVSRNQMFLRVASSTGAARQEWLYCIGAK